LPVYSHSRLSSFENCPLQYRFRYVDRIPAGFESIEAFMGKAVHSVLEGLYRDLDGARKVGPELLVARFEREWDARLTPAVRVVRPDLDAAHYRRLGAECLRKYWQRNHPFHVEPERILGLEMKVEAALDPERRFRIVGYVDRVQRAEAGVLEVHDYKTTATLPREGSLRFDRQLPLYEIALRQRFPRTREVRLIWHFLAHATEAVETQRPEDLDRIRRSTIALIQTVERARDFPARKGPLCAWCEYQDVCPEWKGSRPTAPPAFPNGRPAAATQAAAAPPPPGPAPTGTAPAAPRAVSEPPPAPEAPARGARRDGQLPLF
jgi:putative RecB family exonuclease